jgi:hypothetical protein
VSPNLAPAARIRFADERGLVGRLIITTVILIAVVGLAVVETGSIIFAKLSLENTASAVANDAQIAFSGSHNAKSAEQAALESLQQHDSDAHLVEFSANPQTGVVTVEVKKVAPTLIVQRVKFLKKLGIVTASASSGPGPP